METSEEKTRPPRQDMVRVKWPFRLLVVLSVIALLFTAAVVGLYHFRNDEALARFIMEKVNPTIKGRLEIKKIHWSLDALVNLALGIPARLEAEGFGIHDPRGNRVIYAPKARGKVDLYSLLFGGGHLLIHDLRASGAECTVAGTPGDQPGEIEIGLLETFSSTSPSDEPSDGRLEFHNFAVDGVTFNLIYPGWSVKLKDVSSRGTFRLVGDPARVGLVLVHRTRARRGDFTVGTVRLPLRDLRARYSGDVKKPLEDMQVDLSTWIAGAKLQVKGSLRRLYSSNPALVLNTSLRQLKQLVSRLSGGGLLIDPGAHVLSKISGPFSAPVIDGSLHKVGIGERPYRVDKINGRFVLDTASSEIRFSQISGKPMGGGASGNGRVNLKSGEWNGAITLRDVDPRPVSALAAGKLRGKLELKGNFRSSTRGLAVMDLRLARARRDPLPRNLSIKGSVHLGSEVIDLAGVKIRGDGNTLSARGGINIPRRKLNLFVRLDMPRFGRWMTRQGLPTAVERLNSSLHVTGRIPALRATGKLTLGGVGYGPLRLKQMFAAVEFTGGTLHLRNIRSEGYGGRLHGKASIDLFRGDLTRPRRRPMVQALLKARGLDLTALGAAPHAIGRLFADIQVSGPVDDLKGTATLKVPLATIGGDRYLDSSLRVGLLKDRISIYESHLQRANGGKVKLWGDLYFDGGLDLRMSASAFPVLAIPGLSHTALGLGGKIDGQVRMTGKLVDPRLEGTLKLTRAKIRGVPLGSGTLTLIPGSDAVELKGRFFDKLLTLQGYLFTRPHPVLHINARLTRVPLEKLVYELRQIGDVRGTLSGKVRFTLDSRKGLTSARAVFPTLQLSLRHLQPGRRTRHILKVRNEQELLIRSDGSRFELVSADLLAVAEGETRRQAKFTVGGWVSAEKADVRLVGTDVAVDIARFFLGKRVKEITGTAQADVHLSGPLNAPLLGGHLTFNRVRIKLPKFDRRVAIPRGKIELVPGAVKLSNFVLRVGRDRLTARGQIKLDRFRPTIADLSLKGSLNMELLELFFPSRISSASGSLKVVRLGMKGPLSDPQFTGILEVNPKQSRWIEVSPRGWGRTITLNRGKISLSNYRVKVLSPLRGTYEEGLISVSGEVRLDRWDLVDIFLEINGTGIPQRQPKVYSAEFNMDLILMGDSQQLMLKGKTELVDVRYVRKFDIVKQAFIKPRVHEDAPPFWKGTPLLENLKLDLNVRSTGQMAVKNNYAELSLSGAFNVVGTLSSPRLGGQIRVDEGKFKIPFLRGDYSINRGQITFHKQKTIDEAELDIVGETQFMDRNGADYQIRLMLGGPLNQIGIKLTSNPALDQGQIWALLATGRTTKQLRSQMRGDGDTSSAGGAADAQVKQITGGILDSIITSPLRKMTKLDLLRFEMGTESANVTAKKKLGRYLSLAGEYELGLLGDTRAEGRLELKFHDLMMLVGKLQRLTTRLETDDIDPNQGRVELKIRLPIR